MPVGHRPSRTLNRAPGTWEPSSQGPDRGRQPPGAWGLIPLLPIPFPTSSPSASHRTTSSSMSRCLSRTAWKARCRTTRPQEAPHCPVTRASPPPAAPGVVRRARTCPTPACRPRACAACRNSARSTSRAASSPPSPPGGRSIPLSPRGSGLARPRRERPRPSQSLHPSIP